MTTLRDALAEAFGKAEEGTLETPTETHIDEEPASEQRVRDEMGRFAAKSEEPKQEAEPKAEPQVVEEPKPTRKPPSSWSKDHWDRWGKLEPELQDYIDKREQDYAKGVSTYKSQWDQAAPIYEAIQPFVPELQQHGLQPAQWIQNLGNAHRTLALGTPEQKLQMFAKLATEYGVPLQWLTGQGDPQFGVVTQTLSSLQHEINQFKAQQQAREQAAIAKEIEAFSKSAEHFEAVKPTMAQLLESGVAGDLKTAYEKAVRLHDDIWQAEQAKQAKAKAEAEEAERRQRIAEKKAAAVSPKSSSPTGAVAAGNTKKGLRSMLEEQFQQVTSGRF